MTTKTKRTGRPPTWMTKIDAPPAAISLYEMIASLQHSDVFKTCHVYSGAHDRHSGVPMFKFEGRVHSMPFVISSFMGIEYGKRTCQTTGCVNPFHYAPPSERITPDQNHFVPPILPEDGFKDLLDYYVEEVGIALEFTPLREAIPPEDISDANLRTAIQQYQEP